MRFRLRVPILAASTCALVGIGAGLLGAAGTYQPAMDPDRCAIHSTDAEDGGVTTQTVLSNDLGRVWTKDYYGKSDNAHYTRYYACRNLPGRHVFLGSAREASYEGDEDHPGSFIFVTAQGLEGATVGFSKITCTNAFDRTTCGSKLRVVRLDREGGEARPPVSRRHAVIDAPFLSYTGELFYSVAKPTRGSDCGRGCELHRVSRHGKDRVIDSGTDLRLASMTLAPNGDFFWRNGGEPKVYPPPGD